MQGFFQQYLMLHRPLIKRLNELLSEYDLSYSLWIIVFFIKKNGPSSLVDISNYYHVEKPSITRSVHRLEELQIVSHAPGKDKREKIIHLTERGEDIYRICREKITQLEYQVMQGITEDKKKATYEVLPKIRQNIMNGKDDKHE